MITPTVGRVVWFTPGEGFPGVRRDSTKPLAAIVTHVWGDRIVNLTVLDSDGYCWPTTSVDLVQSEADLAAVADRGRYAEWMPYQKGQAAKSEQLEQQIGADRAAAQIGGP